MGASEMMETILVQGRISKAELSRHSGVSRALIDAYLKGTTQPSLAQVERLARSAGLEIEIVLRPRPQPVPAAFIDVLELGELFPARDRPPLVDLSPVWKAARGA
ncbi:helix-turn-helix transcriptional regulator [Nocardioides sp. R-C-SC26]|uniref:helix-turn-helix domain-containing protein n=1 Tax=Nocardioides sp. R-C-SC26 TaxID=2870414 RepID=UPI001E6023F5|nr:helix-turn-helix transcriptional regulator [Nocardioides sp. R-C-SC26]